MKRTDIERMISLADDRYIDEIFQDKITGRRRNIFVTFTAVAAALALVAGGISYFVSTADRERDITIDTPAISMDDNVIVNETTVIAERPVDYSELFKNKYDGEYPLYFNVYAESEFKNESTSAFEMDYAVSILPFKADGYTDKRSQFYVYLDENGDAFGATVYLESEFDENASPKFKCININLGKDDRLSHNFPIEETVPAKRFGADVYCFDDTAAYTSDAYQSNLKAYFAVGDTEYAVETCNISAAETGEIIDSIIQSGFSANSFDMSKAYGFEHETTNINFDTANSTAPFAGYVPVVDSILYLYQKGVIYDVQRVNGNVSGQYMSVVYTDTTDGGDRIMLEYYTSGYSGKEAFEKSVVLESIGLESLDSLKENGEYKFTINCGNFMINVTAKCSADKLWAYINAIKSNAITTGTIGASSAEITLADARNIAPYGEYVPQTESIGDMKVTSVYYDESTYNGAVQDTAVLVNFMDDNDKHMMLHYGNFKEKVRDKYVPLAEVYDRFESFSEQSEYNADCKQYSFTIDCGNFWIKVNADCTPEEMKMCLDEISRGGTANANLDNHFNFSPFGTLAEANKLEPFAGYVPNAKEIGDMKIYTGYGSEVRKGDSDEYGQILNISYQSEVTSGSTYGGNDFKAIAVVYTEKKAWYNVPGDPIVGFDRIAVLNLDEVKTDGIRENGRVCYRFVIDCGTCYITVAADCLPEEMKQFISEITGTDVQDADDEVEKILTIDKIKELSKKGDDLMWDDFDGYTFTEGGSGLYIRTYTVEEGYSLYIGGGGPDDKPMYIDLSGKGKGRIDIRYESVDEFLGEKVPLNAAEREDANLLTLDKVKELAKKGEDLTWSDFEEFSGVDVGSGMYIMVYPVEDTDYRVTVGGSPDRKPMYIHFGKGDGNYIDLRKDSIDEFLS